MKRSRTFLLTALVVAVAMLGAGVAIAAGTTAPPPRTAFVANAYVPADALAAGPAAGRLGAPIFTTPQGSLSDSAKAGLTAYNPDLVIVLGGTVAIADSVVTAISSATGLAVADIADTPSSGIVRVAGLERTETAQKIADLFSAYDPAFLPADGKAYDADLLDGMDSTDFLGITDTAVDANALEGSTKAQVIAQARDNVRWVAVDADATGATILRQSGGVSNAVRQNQGDFTVDFDIDIDQCNWQATYTDNAAGSASAYYVTVERPLGYITDGLLVRVHNSSGADVDPPDSDGFNLLVTC
jgi:hypothetical protein